MDGAAFLLAASMLIFVIGLGLWDVARGLKALNSNVERIAKALEQQGAGSIVELQKR